MRADLPGKTGPHRQAHDRYPEHCTRDPVSSMLRTDETVKVQALQGGPQTTAIAAIDPL